MWRRSPEQRGVMADELRGRAATFVVDEVPVASERLPEASVSLAARLGKPVIISSQDQWALVDDGALHPLVAAVRLAFDQHRPLVLGPDTVWITLLQGFSMHLAENAEALRSRFVRFVGRRTLTAVVRDPNDRAAWEAYFEHIEDGLSQELGPGIVNLCTRPFSTTSTLERTVMRIVLMVSFRAYFDYFAVGICGIPSITLTGTLEDWMDIRRRVDVLGEYELGWWADAVRPICDQFVAAARGEIDRAFWQAIYKPRQVYEGTKITGWLLRLFPYLVDAMGKRRRNEMALVDAPTSERAAAYAQCWTHEGLPLDGFAAGMSEVEIWYSDSRQEPRPLTLTAGFVGVAQAADSLAVFPAFAWGVFDAPQGATWARLAARHETFTPTSVPDDARAEAKTSRDAMAAWWPAHRAAVEASQETRAVDDLMLFGTSSPFETGDSVSAAREMRLPRSLEEMTDRFGATYLFRRSALVFPAAAMGLVWGPTFDGGAWGARYDCVLFGSLRDGRQLVLVGVFVDGKSQAKAFYGERPAWLSFHERMVKPTRADHRMVALRTLHADGTFALQIIACSFDEFLLRIIETDELV